MVSKKKRVATTPEDLTLCSSDTQQFLQPRKVGATSGIHAQQNQQFGPGQHRSGKAHVTIWQTACWGLEGDFQKVLYAYDRKLFSLQMFSSYKHLNIFVLVI